MKISLDDLSNEEIHLCTITESLIGNMDEKNHQLASKGVFEKYRSIHSGYLELFISVLDENIRLEALKRLIFLNWHGTLEPSFLTGIDKLDYKVMEASYKLLNDFIVQNRLDKEFTWMLSYYSSWDYLILSFSENKLNALTNFVKNVDTSVLNIPLNQISIETMRNRGQLGIYFLTHSEEIDGVIR